jgi:hypothetical protein
MQSLFWNQSHQEFVLNDYHYYSKLNSFLKKKFLVKQGNFFRENLGPWDWLVLNYPEKSFTQAEQEKVLTYLKQGGSLIATAYYQNEDGVASILSQLFEPLGVVFRGDAVMGEDDTPNLYTSRVMKPFSSQVEKVHFPCSCSLKVPEKAHPILLAESGQKSNLTKENPLVLSAVLTVGSGKLFLMGTSVFWDNLCLESADNFYFLNALFQFGAEMS